MRQTAFGDTVIETVEDDMGAEVDLCGTYATIREDDDDGGFYFEIQDNESGESIASSDSFFESADAVRSYLRGWYDHADIQTV